MGVRILVLVLLRRVEQEAQRRQEDVLDPTLIDGRREAVHREEVAEALSQGLVVGRLGQEEELDKLREDLWGSEGA